VNYRELLKKYIGHVAGCEGVSFIGSRYMPNEFTDEEWEELQRLDEELLEEEKRQRAGVWHRDGDERADESGGQK